MWASDWGEARKECGWTLELGGKKSRVCNWLLRANMESHLHDTFSVGHLRDVPAVEMPGITTLD